MKDPILFYRNAANVGYQRSLPIPQPNLFVTPYALWKPGNPAPWLPLFFYAYQTRIGMLFLTRGNEPDVPLLPMENPLSPKKMPPVIPSSAWNA